MSWSLEFKDNKIFYYENNKRFAKYIDDSILYEILKNIAKDKNNIKIYPIEHILERIIEFKKIVDNKIFIEIKYIFEYESIIKSITLTESKIMQYSFYKDGGYLVFDCYKLENNSLNEYKLDKLSLNISYDNNNNIYVINNIWILNLGDMIILNGYYNIIFKYNTDNTLTITCPV